MTYDAIVVGTGITGSFTALALHEHGLRVAVVDRGGLAPGTSRASDGNLLCSDKSPGLMLDLARRVLGSGTDSSSVMATTASSTRRARPSWPVAMSRPKRSGATSRVSGVSAWIAGSWMRTGSRSSRISARIPRQWATGRMMPRCSRCWPATRSRASCRARGCRIFYQAVDDIRTDTDGVAVTLADGRTLDTAHLCVCAGAWTNEVLAPLDRSVPVRPRKGHIAVLERGDVAIHSKIADFGYNATAESTDADDGSVQTATIIEATRSGTILCGSSREFAGFDTTIDERTVRRIMADCIGVVPDLARLRVIRAYTGLRPFSPDGYPIIGPLPGDERVLVATGQEGAGHGLAPISGKLVADCIVNGNTYPVGGQLHPGRWNAL